MQEIKDYGVEAGGPLVRGRAWVWGSYGSQDIGVGVNNFFTPGCVPASNRPEDELTTIGFYAFSEITEVGGHNQTVRWDGIISPRWFIEASFARGQNDIVELPSVDEWNVANRTVTPTVLTGGIGFFESINDSENLQHQVKSTHLFHAGGEHQVRGGLIFEDISFDRTIQRTGPPITLADGQRTVTGAQVEVIADPTFGRIFRVVRANTSNVAATNQDYLSLFVQDQWRVGDRLTIIGGLRWDRQKLEGLLADFTWDQNFAPRIGATFAPLGTGRLKVFGNWGRYYAKIPQDIAVRSLSADAGVTRADYFDAGLTQPIPNGVRAGGQTNHLQFAGLEPAAFAPDMNGGSFDERVVGVEYEALPGLNLGVRYIGRRLNDIVEDIGTGPLVSFLGPEADSVEFFVTNPSVDSPVVPGFGASHVDPVRDYDAIEVTADKRLGDNWQMQASYRWGKLEGNYEGFFRNDNGQSDPGITSLFDFPPNDPSYAPFAEANGFRGDPRFLRLARVGDEPATHVQPEGKEVVAEHLHLMPPVVRQRPGVESGVRQRRRDSRRTARFGLPDGRRLPDTQRDRIQRRPPRRLRVPAAGRTTHHSPSRHLQPVQPRSGDCLRQSDRARFRGTWEREPGLRRGRDQPRRGPGCGAGAVSGADRRAFRVLAYIAPLPCRQLTEVCHGTAKTTMPDMVDRPGARGVWRRDARPRADQAGAAVRPGRGNHHASAD